MTAIQIPRISCLGLPSLEKVGSAFASAPRLVLGQPWREAPEPRFRPGTVSLGWSSDSWVFYAELDGESFSNRATRLNERTWELGDVFEVFLKAESSPEYFEFHITPEGQHLQLRFPYAGAARESGREPSDFYMTGEEIHSKGWSFPLKQRWEVLVQIPFRHFNVAIFPGSRWNVSFGRYHYTAGVEKPVLSSTSNHSVVDFHQVEEWSEVMLR